MNYLLSIPGFEGQTLEVQPGGFFSKTKLFVNGAPAPPGAKRGQMVLRRNDDQEVIATWKTQPFDIPKLIVDGTLFNVVEPLKWYQWVWGGLPLLLIPLGGMLGGVIGVIGFAINAKIFVPNGIIFLNSA